MAKLFENLTFDALAYRYGQSLDILDETLSAAEQGLLDKRARILAQLADYEAGGVRIGEWDDGHKIWDQADVYQHEIDSLEEALADLRKPYVVAFYHTWERMVARWAGLNTHADFTKLRKAVQAKGIIPHPRLEAVRDLANALKHNSRNSGAKLLESWPDILPQGFSIPTASDKINWYEIIRISADQIREVSAALRQSGPEPFSSRPEQLTEALISEVPGPLLT